MNDDERNLDLLSIFHYVLGALMALFPCLFLIHIGMGVAMLLGAFDGPQAPPPEMGWLFILIPGFFMLVGWTVAAMILIAGRKLKRRVSRTYCLVVGAIECVFMPLGTILGVFTILVLTRDSVKELFEANESPRGF